MPAAFDPTAWLATLSAAGNAARAQAEKRYLKSSLVFYGVSLPELRRSTRAWLAERPGLSRAALVATVRGLWKEPVHEARALAVLLLEAREELLRSGDLPLLESLLRRSGTWAYVDAIAVHVAGPLVARERKLLRSLDRWARDEDFWIRRSAMLALLLPLRRGEGEWDRFARYADAMLDEREFFIRKAIGWVLREHGKRRPDRVAAFLRPRRDRVSGVTLREALKVLPAGAKRELSRRPKG